MIPELEPDFPEGSVGHWIKQQSEDWQEIIVQRMREQGKLFYLNYDNNFPLRPLSWSNTIEGWYFWVSVDKFGYTNIPFSYNNHCTKYKVGKYAEHPIVFAPVTTTATIDGKQYTLEITIKATPNG